VLHRPLFLTVALAAFVVAALLPGTAAAGTLSKVIELKSNSEDAKRIVANILEKEAGRLDRCGEKYMAAKPKGPFLVRLKIRLSPQEAQVLPVKAADAKHPAVGCVGSALAGVSWPKPSGKIDVVAEILLGRVKGPATRDQDLDLDQTADDSDSADAQEQRRAEAHEREREAKARAEKQRRAEAHEREREAKARAEKQRRAEAHEREQEAKARHEKERRAEARDREREEETRRDSSAKPGGSSVQWRTAQVGYVASSVEGGLSRAEVASEFDDSVLPKIGKAWRRARAFNAMVRLRISIGVKGQVETADILKSSDAVDFESEVVDAVKATEWPASDQDITIEWTFAFRR
jgi:TonB family protein